jgi:hypothetical protein
MGIGAKSATLTGPTRSHQDLLLLRPKESKNSSNSSREFSLPTGYSSDHPQSPREIGLRDIAKPAITLLVLFKTPNPDGSKVDVLKHVGDFPIGKSAHEVS